MTKFIIKTLITAAAVYFGAYILKGVHVDGTFIAIWVALVLALLNTFVKPILTILTIPITIVTLGLFLLVINILIIKFADILVDGFTVDGWWSALLFSLLVSIVSSFLESLFGTNKKENNH